MSDEKPVEPKSADELIKTKKPGDVQLTEEDLSKASGGMVDSFFKGIGNEQLTEADLLKISGGGIDGVPGDSMDDKHKAS